MRLSALDDFLWAAGFVANFCLLLILCYRGRAQSFPFFTSLISLDVIRTIVLYLVRHRATNQTYLYTYWLFALLDTLLQLCVVYEIASSVFRPVDVWAVDVRRSFVWLLSLGITVACGLTWIATPPASLWIQALVYRGNFFAGALLSELFVAMMALSVHVGLAWKTHVAKIAQGLGAYSLITVAIGTGYGYFGTGRALPAFVLLSHIRMTAYLGCVAYWMIGLWPDEGSARPMTAEMREKMFTLQLRLDYYLQGFRSRTKL